MYKKVLNKTNFRVSLRPHPREKTKTYIDNIEHWFRRNAHRVEIDDSSVFIDWVKKQKSITTPFQHQRLKFIYLEFQ